MDLQTDNLGTDTLFTLSREKELTVVVVRRSSRVGSELAFEFECHGDIFL